MTPTMITGSGTRLASRAPASAAAAPAFNARTNNETDEGLATGAVAMGAGVRCMAFTFI